MSETKQTFSVSRAQDAVYKTGLRSFMEYRDLGVDAATQGQFRAHVIRIKKEAHGDHALHTTGLDCSDDVEILEVYLPAVHQTVVMDQMPAQAAAR
jgi:hypothetical protein